MGKQIQSFRTAILGATLCLAFVAGCGDREAELEKMAADLKSNTSNRHGSGLSVGYSFWVDKEMSRKTTVGAKLTELRASMSDGKVVDAAGRELYFYRVAHRFRHKLDTRPLRPTEEEEIAELEKTYHVIRTYVRPPTE